MEDWVISFGWVVIPAIIGGGAWIGFACARGIVYWVRGDGRNDTQSKLADMVDEELAECQWASDKDRELVVGLIRRSPTNRPPGSR
jgi:hypothetical protein